MNDISNALEVIIRSGNSPSPNTSAKTSSKERTESDFNHNSTKMIKKKDFKKQRKFLKAFQEKIDKKLILADSPSRRSPEKDSTESFEDLGKGLVLIVNGEDSLTKSGKRINNIFQEIESKNENSRTNSKDMSSKVLTRDEDASDSFKKDQDNNLHLSIIRNTRKDSASFTAVFGSENMSNNSVSPVSGSDNRDEVKRKYSNEVAIQQNTR